MKKFLILAIFVVPINLCAQQWVPLSTLAASDISCPDSIHGWALVGSSEVIYTNDGGSNWTEKTINGIGDTAKVTKICFVDSLHGWAGGGYSYSSGYPYYFGNSTWFIMSTQNGFNTWFCYANGGEQCSGYYYGSFTEMIIASGKLFWTDFIGGSGDAGSEIHGNGSSCYWDLQYSPIMSFTDNLHGWVLLCSYGNFFKTNTGISGFSPYKPLYYLPNINDINFIDTLHGWVVGDSGEILYTNNGGTDSIWQPESSGVTNTLDCVKFVDSLNGWVGGDEIILRTRDGGHTWVTDSSLASFPSSVSKICCKDTNYAWALSSDGTIWKYQTYTGIEESSKLKVKSASGGAKMEIAKNPFRQTTVISYSIPEKTNIRLTIYDLSGRCVKTLVDGERTAGSYNINVNAKELSSGVYFVKFVTGNYKETKKLVLMK